MNKKILAKRLIIGSSIVFAVGLATYFGVKLSVRPKDEDDISDSAGSNLPNDTVRPPSESESVPQSGMQQGKDGFPLRVGDKGVGVAYLQAGLKCLGKYEGVVDGRFGVLTYQALISHFWFSWSTCRGGYRCEVTRNEWIGIMGDALKACRARGIILPDTVVKEYSLAHGEIWTSLLPN